MRIVIVGGSGLVGSRLARLLQEAGHEVVAASRRTGIDSYTGEGLQDAIDGAHIVVDVTNPPDYSAAEHFFTVSTRRQIEAETTAGVRAHVILSIVGIDRVPGNPYYAAKLTQERVARTGDIPVVVLRATQFFEFVDTLLPRFADLNEISVSTEPLQPVAVGDVVEALAQLVTAPPPPGTREIAGPEVIPLDEYLRRTLAALGDPRPVFAAPGADSLRLAGAADALIIEDRDAIIGRTTFGQWLAQVSAD